jgi:TRAP-type C4-dicarboxylate transport system permease small subunit
MDVIVGMMPPKARAAADLFSELLFIVTALLIVVFASPVIRDLWAFDQRSQSADVPLVIPQALIPIGFVLMILLVVARLLSGGGTEKPAGSGH